MWLIILIFCISKTLASYESSNENGKYIDLLPDEEKREFLDRVARRILAQVKTKQTPYTGMSSVEIPDDQLDKHNDFVNKILEEESKNLRTGTDSEKGDSKERRVKQDIFGNNFTDANRNNDDEHYIDLTLRQGIRHKRNSSIDTDIIESTTETRHIETSFKTEFDDEINANVTKNSHELIDDNDDKIYKTDTDIQVRGIKRHSRQTMNNKTVDSEIQIPVMVVQSNDEKSKLQVEGIRSDRITEKSVDTTTISNDDKGFTDNLNTTNASVKSFEQIAGNTTESSIDDSVVISSTTVTKLETDTPSSETYKNDINNLKENNTHFVTYDYKIVNDSNKTINKDEVSLKNEQYTNGDIKDTTVMLVDELTSSVFFNNESKQITTSKVSGEENTPYITTEILDVISKSNIENQADDVSQLNITNIEIYSPKTHKEATSTTEIMPITKHTLQLTNLKTNKTKKSLKSVIKQDITEDRAYDLTVNIKNRDDNTNLNIATNIINALRQRTDVKETKNENVRRVSYDIKQSMEQTINTYQVYEIKPGQVPFVKRQVKPKKPKQEDRHYYVPIYNYSPNNAYYYPYNKFGPNYDLNESDDRNVYMSNMNYNDEYIPITYRQDDYANNRKFRFKVTKQEYRNRKPYSNPVGNRKPYQLILPLAPIRAKPAKSFFDNYLDGDYYFNDEDRIDTNHVTGKIDPNSDENHYVDNAENFRKTQKVFSNLNSEYSFNSNLKDHLRSVRNKLEKKKYGYNGLSDNEREVKVRRDKKDDIYAIKLEQPLEKRSRHNGLDGISADYFFGSDKAKHHITGVVSKILPSIERSNYYESNKKRWGKWPKLKRNKDYLDVSATPYPIKHEHDMVNKLLPIVQTSKFENKIRYSNNIEENTSYKDNNFILQNLDELIGPPTTYHQVDDEISAFVTTMQNLLDDKSKALQQYDWLESTVKIQSAIDKLSDMTDNLLNGIVFHPADLELLKYTTFLHTVAKHELAKNYTAHERDISQRSIKKHKSALPRNKRKPKHNIIKTKGLMERVWLYRANIDVIAKYDLYDFVQFLDDLQNSLYDLHNAVKHISLITNYRNQRWFQNLLDLYLYDAKRKQYLELILHLSTVRLIDLVEESSRNGLEDNFMVYIQKNIKTVRRSIEEFIFVKRLLEEIKKM